MKYAAALCLLPFLPGLAAVLPAQPMHSLALRPTLYNYHAPLRDNSPAFSDVFGKNSGGGVEVAYYRRLLPNVLLGLPLRVGRANTDRRNPANAPEWLVHLDVLAQQHFFKPSAMVQPYLHVGMGAAYDFGQPALEWHFPVGVGVNVRLTKQLYLTAQTQHRFAGDERDAWHHALGLQLNFGKELPSRKKKDEEPTRQPLDGDADGIPDAEDRCPDRPGPAALSGCPDGDGDGVPDKDDRCPDKPGPASNFGCPPVSAADLEILNSAVRNVQFATNSANLLASSYAVLDQVAALMERYPEYHLYISGHTDSVGDDKFNLDLSKRRAKACYDYLVSKGVNPGRMRHEGYGETRPIADNSTEAGRARNRRVEFELRLP